MTDAPPALTPAPPADRRGAPSVAPPAAPRHERTTSPTERAPTPRSRSRVWAVALGAWTLTMCIAFLIPGERLPDTGSWGFDKLEHVAVFALWTLIGRAAGLSARTVVVAGLLFGAATEITQHLLPMLGRAGDVRDLVADAAGIAIGLGLVALIGRHRAGR